MFHGGDVLMVPFLVTDEEVNLPVIVIEEIVKGDTQSNRSQVVNMIESSFEKAEALVNLIEKKVSCKEPEGLGDVKIGSKDIVIPKGRNFKLKCVSHCGPVNVDTPVMFQPDLNLDLVWFGDW